MAVRWTPPDCGANGYVTLTQHPALCFDKAFEYGPAHKLRGQAATIRNANLRGRLYPFCIRLGGRRDRLPAHDERV